MTTRPLIDKSMNPARIFLTPWLAKKERGDFIPREEALSVAEEPEARWPSVAKLIRTLMQERGMTVTAVEGGYKVDTAVEQVDHGFRHRRAMGRKGKKALHAFVTAPADELTQEEIRRRDFGLNATARDVKRFDDDRKALAAIGRPEPKPNPRLKP